MRRTLLFPIAVMMLSCASPRSRSEVDPRLAKMIEQIKAIDNHAHPTLGPDDKEFDPIPVDAMAPSPSPIRVADANEPRFKFRDHAKDAAGVLDAAGIEIMLANRISMGTGLDPARFKWVPFADPLMYPLNNEAMSKNPDRKPAFAAEEKLLKRYLSEAGLSAMPATFDDYLSFVTKTIERHKQQGAVAEKFEMAYLRTLAVGRPLKANAEHAFNIYSKAALATDDEYKTVQDYIFRHIATVCGRLNLSVHIHSSAGAGGFFEMGGANPMNLEGVFNDPELRKTQFVLIHGGWPATREAVALLTKPNVWMDFSSLDLLLEPRVLAGILREAIGYMPDKVMFGTDAGPWGPGLGLEETARAASNAAREALGIALTGMVRDGEITNERAETLARMVMRENARHLYGMK